MYKTIEKERFEELFIKYRPYFITIARSYVRELMAAEEIVIDSFMSYWEKREELEERIFLPYVFSTVKNKSLNWLRSEKVRLRKNKDVMDKRLKEVEFNLSSLKGFDPDLLFEKEIEEILKRTLAEMPPLTRSVFLCHREEGLTYHEIASRHSLTYRQVDYEIQKALTLLRKALKDYVALLILWQTIN